MIKVNGKVVQCKRFPDGTSNVKGNSTLWDGEIIITWNYYDDSEFMVISFLTKYYQSHGNKVILYLPYVPNARMDRVEQPEDIFTLKYFGEMINSLNFEKVFVLDTHSSVVYAVIKNCNFISSDVLTDIVFKDIINREGKIPVVFFPDEGAMKRYSKGMMNPDIPVAFGLKKRDWNTGNILGLDVLGLDESQIKGRNILIRDDICSKGGTFYYAAKKLKEMGAANIYLLVTHCEDSIYTGEFGVNKTNLLDSGLINHVYTTDSIYSLDDNEKVTLVHMEIGYSEDERCD